MIEIRTITRKLGKFVGILLDKRFKLDKKMTKAGDIFGKLNINTPNDKLMKQIDEDLWAVK